MCVCVCVSWDVSGDFNLFLTWFFLSLNRQLFWLGSRDVWAFKWITNPYPHEFGGHADQLWSMVLPTNIFEPFHAFHAGKVFQIVFVSPTLCVVVIFFVGFSKERTSPRRTLQHPHPKTSKFPYFPQRFWVSVKLVLTLGSEVILPFPCRWQLKHFWNFYPEPRGNDLIWLAHMFQMGWRKKHLN